MKLSNIKFWTKTIIIPVFLVFSLTSCIVVGDGVVRAVEGYYATSKKDVLVVSGKTASHPIYGVFDIDNPVEIGKIYKNENGATLEFRHDGTISYAVIKQSGEERKFQFLNYGAPKKEKVVGICWQAE